MPPRIRLPISYRTIYAHPHAALTSSPSCLRLTPVRRYTDSRDPPLDESPKGPNQDVLGHVSEEAADTANITGEQGPELEQGTPVQDVLKRDSEAQKKAPEVLKDQTKPSSKPSGSRSYSTLMSNSLLDETEVFSEAFSNDLSIPQTEGIKFGLPEMPLPGNAHLRRRYDPVVEQITNLMMRHGKKGVAQRNMSMILNILRSAPPPTTNPSRPLLPGAPPPSHLPLNPELYLTLAIDSIAPLLRIRSQKGGAGGGVALQIPVPLTLKQRRRRAFQWILTAAEKKQFRGSGRGGFAQKIAEEIIAVVEGRSSAWDRRNDIHRIGVGARSSLLARRRRR